MTGRPVCWASSIPFAPLRVITEQHCSLNIYDFPAVFKEIGNTFFPFWQGPAIVSESMTEIVFFFFDRDMESFSPLYIWQRSGIGFFFFDRTQESLLSSLTGLRNRFPPLWQRSGIPFFFFDRDQESLVSPLTEIIFRIISLCQGTGIVCFLFDRDQELLLPLWQRSGITCFVFDRDKKLFLFNRDQKTFPLWQESETTSPSLNRLFPFERDQESPVFSLTEIRNCLFPFW